MVGSRSDDPVKRERPVGVGLPRRPVDEVGVDVVEDERLLTIDDRLVGLVPEEHRLAKADSVTIGELADESWIAGCPRCRRQLVEVCESAGFAPRIDFATDDYPAVIGLVGAGLGVAVLPELAIESVRPKGARAVTVEPAVRREIVALTLPDLAQVPAVAATLDHLARAAAR